MGERRSHRTSERTDDEIQAHEQDMRMLREVAAGRVRMEPAVRSDLRRLDRDGLLIVGFGRGQVPTLLPRGDRLLNGTNGEYVGEDEE